jgi:type I restriction enzyme S subunit
MYSTGDPIGQWNSAPTDWKGFVLWDLADYVNGAAFKPSDFNESGLRVIKITELKYGISPTTTFYNGEIKEKYLIDQGDLLFAWSGNPETSLDAFIWRGDKAILNQHIFKVLPKDLINKYYLYFLLKFLRPTFIRTARDKATSMGHVKVRDLKRLIAFIPSLPEQHAIAEILGTLENKMEVNRRMNHTLELVVRAVFREWFVENEEVNNWDKLTWGEIATLEYGKSLSGYKDSNAPYVVYGTNGPIGTHTEPLYQSEGIVIGRKGAYRGIHFSPEPFFVIDTAFYLKPQKPFSMKWAYYELLRFDLNSMDSGSAIPSTSRTDFYGIPVLFPPQELMNSFEAFVTPLFSKIYANEKESRTLASLRDMLLPKLMKGEVRVNEV